jgi:hypothetical protein
MHCIVVFVLRKVSSSIGGKKEGMNNEPSFWTVRITVCTVLDTANRQFPIRDCFQSSSSRSLILHSARIKKPAIHLLFHFLMVNTMQCNAVLFNCYW